MRNKISLSRITSIFVGVVFVLSASGKASDIESFANNLMIYGHRSFIFLAPFITGFEFFLGLCLILGVNLQLYAKTSFLLTLLFTIVFAFGLIYQNVNDCACFGSWIKFSPIVTFFKNGLILILLYYTWKDNIYQKSNPIKLLASIFIGLATFFINAYEITQFYKANTIFVGDNIYQTTLGKYVKDNNQIILLFDPHCSHCQNIVPKLSNSKMSVLGLYANYYDGKEISDFKNKFKPTFPINSVNTDLILSITKSYPLLIRTENSKVVTISNE